MPDNTRMPRIGEIWRLKEHHEVRIVILLSDAEFTDYITDDLEARRDCTGYVTEDWEPTNTEYDLDPLILALKGDHA